MKIRKEINEDSEKIFALNASAFPSEVEARLVDRLRETATPFVSLLAEEDGEIKGHILFTPVTLDSAPELSMLGLAPMAVAPQFQNSGIGSRLVEAGLEECRKLDTQAVIVLGHPDYYPRFGFVPSVNYGIKSEYDVPDEVFLVRELIPGSLSHKPGIVSYHPAFARI
ncbi:MAG: N-acetyltransferase [Gammaproteobacteria bacterium]|nr:N-acetyltransferase [Gammaproteobacteria bacterium]MDD9895579.1 N-acetyltransferase [Gammaproteobacteria bacterium]MDD9959722.1 N-acetyltransferase [Gammaproteobacteria bacterium]